MCIRDSLYVSGEESAEQIKLRSERLGDIDNEFYLYAETNMQAVRSQVEAIKPDFLIIDSIQTLSLIHICLRSSLT